MNPEHMVHKANQIALYFASFPREEAIAGIADHMKKFWEPRMRRQMYDYIAGGGGGLHELVPPAVEVLKQLEAATTS